MRCVFMFAALVLTGCASGGTTLESPNTTPSNTTVATGGSLAPSSVTIEGVRTTSGSVRTLSAPIDRVWEVLPQVYQELDIPVKTINSDARVLGNVRVPLNGRLGGEPLSRFLDCGEGPFGAPIANSYRVEMSVLTGLTPVDAGTRVETRVTATASNRAVSGGAVTCGSSGRLEERIAERIQARLGS